jgi:hypothetical protein
MAGRSLLSPLACRGRSGVDRDSPGGLAPALELGGATRRRAKITAAQLVDLLKPTSVWFEHGLMCVSFRCGDVFTDHAVRVTLGSRGQLKDADIW